MNVDQRPVGVPIDWIQRDCTNPACLWTVWVIPNQNVVPVCSATCATEVLDSLMIGAAPYL